MHHAIIPCFPDRPEACAHRAISFAPICRRKPVFVQKSFAALAKDLPPWPLAAPCRSADANAVTGRTAATFRRRPIDAVREAATAPAR